MADLCLQPEGSVTAAKVGIGTKTPTAKLDVKGDAKIRTGSSGNSNLWFGNTNGGQLAAIEVQPSGGFLLTSNSDGGSFTFRSGASAQNTLLKLGSNGNVGVGGSPDDTKLLVRTASAGQRVIRVYHSDGSGNKVMVNFNRGPTWAETGSIQSTMSSTYYATTSDRRLKGNITDTTRGGPGGGLDLLGKIQVRDFHFKIEPDVRLQGYIAQELRALYPEAVTEAQGENGFMGVDYGRLSPLIVQAVQELRARTEKDVEGLRKSVAELVAENRRLRERLDAIE